MDEDTSRPGLVDVISLLTVRRKMALFGLIFEKSFELYFEN